MWVESLCWTWLTRRLKWILAWAELRSSRSFNFLLTRRHYSSLWRAAQANQVTERVSLFSSLLGCLFSGACDDWGAIKDINQCICSVFLTWDPADVIDDWINLVVCCWCVTKNLVDLICSGTNFAADKFFFTSVGNSEGQQIKLSLHILDSGRVLRLFNCSERIIGRLQCSTEQETIKS